MTFLLVIALLPIQAYGESRSDNHDILDNDFLNDVIIYCEAFLESQGYKSELNDPTTLYNFEDNIEAICFSLSEDGYIIINVNDLSVPEFSFTAPNPYSNYKNDVNYYNGPLSYYRYEDNKFINLKSGVSVNKLDINKKYTKPKLNIDNKIEEIISMRDTILVTERVNNYLKLPKWSSSYYCGIDACAILLAYYDDVYNNNFVDSSVDSSPALQKYLADNNYIKNGGTTAYDLVTGGFLTKYKGLRDYVLSRVGWSANYISYTFDRVKSSVESNHPVIVGTDPGHPINDNHWIIAYGYRITTSYEYLIVNDGFGNNEIFTTRDETLYDDIVYLYP